MNEFKDRLAVDTSARTFAQACVGADVLIGVSAPGMFNEQILKSLNDRPIIFAMSNPEPEVRPELAKKIRPDCIIATGRSDYPNQINNVMCFPFLFRATLDVRAKQINEEMKMAAAMALANLAKQPVPNVVKEVYKGRDIVFGKEYIIPTPFDPRLIFELPVAVAKAAMESGIAQN
jgi:malate dehydrogenase (oxaloacetate-decarboxylating)(NADP+)